MNTILSVTDFDQILDDYAGRTLAYTPVTQSVSNITGEETLIDGTPKNIKCYVMKTGQNFNYKEFGFMEQGDMVGLFKIADGVTKNSKITVNSETFRIKEKFDVPGVFTSSTTATYVYSVCNLFLIS